MSRWQKLSIGLAAALLAGWVSHGPLGRGTAYVDRLEAERQGGGSTPDRDARPFRCG